MPNNAATKPTHKGGASPLAAYFIERNPELEGMDDIKAQEMAIKHITDSDAAAKQIMDAMERDPLAVEVLQEFGRTGSFIAALAKFYTPEEYQEEFEALTEGSPAYQAKQATLSDRKEKKEKEAERKNAFENSQQAYEKWVAEKGLSEEEQELFEEAIMQFAQIFEDGKITEEELDKLWSMYDMENIVDAALNDGKLAGRNEAIAARRAKAKTKKLTPVPEINGGGSTNETELPEDVRELNDIAQASKRSNRF